MAKVKKFLKMNRIKITLPLKFHFECNLTIQISDINYGGHLSNDALLKLVHEARIRFLKKMNLSEMNIGGVGLIMIDASLVFKFQAFYGDEIIIKIALTDLNPFGFNLIYHIIKNETKIEIARVKTGFVSFDYKSNRLVELPKCFKDVFFKTFVQ